MLLMSPRSQRKSRALTQATPCGAARRVGGFIALAIMKTVGSMPGGMTWSRIATPRVTWM